MILSTMLDLLTVLLAHQVSPQWHIQYKFKLHEQSSIGIHFQFGSYNCNTIFVVISDGAQVQT